MEFDLCCPVCEELMRADTDSGEEFSCTYCRAMADILDDDLTMLSLPPHDDVYYMPTRELRWRAPILA